MTNTESAAGRPVVAASGVTKIFGAGDAAVHALRGIDVDFQPGTFSAIMGPSGSGKSTLMHCLAGLDTVTDGSVRLGDLDITAMGDRDLTRLRREKVGFVFQSFNLLPTLTAEQNIVLPLDIAGRRLNRELFDLVVDIVGLRDRLGHRPAELSGGQQQRVAVARAFIGEPRVVFADEPTGNLDSSAGADVLDFLRVSVRRLGQTIVMVTHDAAAASYADRIVFLRDGRLVHEMREPTAEGVLDTMKKLES